MAIARVGNWAIPTFLVLTFLTMFTVLAGVTIVTAGLAANLIGAELPVIAWSALVLGVVCLLLGLGQYPWLDRLTKVLVVLLAAATLTAGVIAFGHGPRAPTVPLSSPIWTVGGIAFVVALMGWMPAPIEISVWHSLWTLERRRQTKYAPSLGESLFDFNIGYGLTAFLAFIFLSLGAMLMFGSGEEFESTSAGFTAQLIRLYTATLGDWTWPIIAIAAFATMFSTTLAVSDAYPRVWQRAIEAILPNSEGFHSLLYWSVLLLIAIGSLVIIYISAGNLRFLVDLATIISFLSAPVYGFLNYRVVMHPGVPENARPPLWMRRLSWFGLAFLTVFGVLFLTWRFA